MFNVSFLMGYLGEDAELRYSSQGSPATRFSLATSEQWKDKNTGEKREKTEWHRCVIFGTRAENLHEFLKKGTLVHIEGQIHYSLYDDRENPTIKRRSVQIVVRSLRLVSSKKKDQPENVPPEIVDDEENVDEDISFPPED